MRLASRAGALLEDFRSGEIYRIGLIGLVVTMSLRTFQFFPGVRPLEEIWFVLCALVLLVLYPLLKTYADWTFRPFELYLLCMLPIFLILPGVAAQRNFGQPLVYGILARRSMLLSAMWLLMIEAWRRRWFQSRDVEKVLVFMAWGTSFLYDFMRLFLNPLNFESAPAGFLRGSGTIDVSFATPGCFMIFGAIYYSLRAIRERRTRWSLYAFYFAINAVGTSGRFLTISFLVTVGYFLFRWRSFGAVVSIAARSLAVFALAISVLAVISPQQVQERFDRFADAFSVVTGHEVEDASAYARVVETDIALPYIKRHPIIGNGLLSTQWIAGAAGVASYFFPDDIGLVGVVYEYSAIGLVLFSLQYLFSLRAGFQLPDQVHTPILDASKGFLVYTAIYSLTTGTYVFEFEQPCFFIVLLLLATDELRSRRPVPRAAVEARQELTLT